MPWQDVAVSFDGDAAFDVAMGFIQRWNNHTAFQAATDMKEIKSFPKPLASAQSSSPGACSVRVVRSIAEVRCPSALSIVL
jgi:phosphatidylserine/phosphatidylglycerophosphate/cardiolipin synthase-like enzyme